MRETLLKWEGMQILIEGIPEDKFYSNRNLWKNCKVIWSEDLVGKTFQRSLNNIYQTHEIDHLWIDQGCMTGNIIHLKCSDRRLATGRVEKYQRSDGTIDLNIVPVSHDEQVDILLGFFCYEDVGILAFCKPRHPGYTQAWRKREETLARVAHFLNQYRVRTKTGDKYAAIASFIRQKIAFVSRKLKSPKTRVKTKSSKGFGGLVA